MSLCLRLACILLGVGTAAAAAALAHARHDLHDLHVNHERALAEQPQQPNFDSFDLLDIPAPSYSWIMLQFTPAECAAYSAELFDPTPGHECPTFLRTYEVTYGDCGTPFVLCHCAAANITIEEAIDHLARVPVGLRRQVGTVMVMPAPFDTSSAYTVLDTGETHIFGVPSQKSWVHETVHSADGGIFSSTSSWQDAVSLDSCVPDPYSQTNYLEDFAQTGVLVVYSLLHGTLPPGFSEDCMANQLNFLNTLPLFNKTTLFGDTCAIADNAARHTAPPLSLQTDAIITGSYTDGAPTGSGTSFATTIPFVDGQPPDSSPTATNEGPPGATPSLTGSAASVPSGAAATSTRTSGSFVTGCSINHVSAAVAVIVWALAN